MARAVAVSRAATDLSWAQKQQAGIRSEYLTTGRYFTDKDATVRTLTSGWDVGVSDRAADILRTPRTSPGCRERQGRLSRVTWRLNWPR
jgi:hypothetical protein